MSISMDKSSHAAQPERFCKYIHRYCYQTRLDGYDYCIRHILEDKSAPFRQCIFVNQPNKKRCSNAAPKSDKGRDGALCPFHAKRALARPRPHQVPKRKAAPDGPAVMLKNLEHYCQDPVHDPNYRRDPMEPQTDRPLAGGTEGGKPSTMEQMEEAVEGEPLANRAHVETIEEDFSCSESTSYLDHAGVYTYKEICAMTREKLLKLQHLYCVELKVLCHDFKEARRRYLKMARNPFPEVQRSPKLVYKDLKDVRGRIVAKIEKPPSSEAGVSPLDKKLRQSLQSYHRRNGVERILRRRLIEVRAKVPKPVRPACAYEENGLKCTSTALMGAQFCKNHILNDPNQGLFMSCPQCKCTRPGLPTEEDSACDMHFSVTTSHGVMEEQVAEFSPSLVLEEAVPQPENPPPAPSTSSDMLLEPEHFQSMDDIASLGLDAIGPGLLFGLDQFGEPGDTVLDQGDLMQIPAISLNPPADILSDSHKSGSDDN